MHFVVNKKVYQFPCLPLATSPREFTKLLRPVVALLRQRGVKLHVYLEDWLIRAHTPEQAQLHAQTTIRVLQFLGWIINYEKSDLTPSQEFQFIGMQFNTRQFTVAPLPKMRLKVQSIHQHWMTNPNITACDLHRLLSVLVFMASLVRRGRLRLRLVQWWAATAWCQRTGSWTDRITVPQWVLSEVAWWASPAVLQGLPLAAKETEVTLFTESSSSGWGAQLGSRSTQGQWSASQRSWHINVLEMQAVINAVRDFLPHLRLERPVQGKIMPKWDLHLVLSSLLKPPFASECDIQRESSDDVIPLKWRTMKTVPVSIGFSETALIHSRVECRSRQVCVRERASTDVCSLESQHQRYHEKSHQPMDRGSLHSS